MVQEDSGNGTGDLVSTTPAQTRNSTPAVWRLVETATGIMGAPVPTDRDRAFLARQLVQATLPHSDPGDVPVWTRANGRLMLVMRQDQPWRSLSRSAASAGEITSTRSTVPTRRAFRPTRDRCSSATALVLASGGFGSNHSSTSPAPRLSGTPGRVGTIHTAGAPLPMAAVTRTAPGASSKLELPALEGSGTVEPPGAASQGRRSAVLPG